MGKEGSSSLTSLHLCACGITANGATHLAEGVRKSESLATLTLHGNMIGDGGARGQGKEKAGSSTITTLNLSLLR
jgi:hypothetical protein